LQRLRADYRDNLWPSGHKLKFDGKSLPAAGRAEFTQH